MSRSSPHQHDSDHRPGCLPGWCDWFLMDPAGDIVSQCGNQCHHFRVVVVDGSERRYCWGHGQRIAERMGVIVWRGDDPVYDPPDEPLTCPDSVYFIKRQDGLIKIGKSNNPAKRLRALQTAAGLLELIHTEPGGLVRERRLHDRFSEDRVEGEWFKESEAIRNYLVDEGAERSNLIQ